MMNAHHDPSLCTHCGSPVPAGREDGFCCAGCSYVHDLLHQEGLDHFYDLKGSTALPPVAPQALRERDYEWLTLLSTEAEGASESDAVELRLAVQGLSCVGCVWLIERVFARHAGALRINVDVVHGEVRLTWQRGQFDAVAVARDLQSFGYLLGPPVQGGEKKESSGLARRMGVCGAFAMNAMAFSLPAYFGMPPDFAFAHWFDLIAAFSATLAMAVGGSYFIERAWRSLRAGVLHIDTPIALGVSAAYLGSMGGWIAGVEGLKYFDFVAIFIFLMLAGRWAQQAAVDRNRRRLMRDTSISETVNVLNDVGMEEMQPVASLKQGVRFVVKSGQTVPVASKLISEDASVSLEWINGESEAQAREEGQLLPSGALNIGMQSLTVEAVETWEDSTLRRLLDARREAEFRDVRLEKILRAYLVAVVVTGFAGAIWWWSQGAGVVKALQVMISIFVVSCPCALGVAVPLAEEMAASRAEKLGVFVRALGLWKRLMRVKRVVFDKTGTLTLENPVLENPEVLRALDVESRAALRHLVTGNLHPVSRSLYDAVAFEGDSKMMSGAVKEAVGHGLSFNDTGGHEWRLGRPEGAIAGDAVLMRDGAVLAAFRFRDELRAESVQEVRHLHERRIEVCVLSGDRAAKVAEIAHKLELPDLCWMAELTPEAKAQWLRGRNRDDTLYVGDGANDSLAFDEALCAGSPVTGRSFLEQKADFFFLGHSLRFVSGLMNVARLHRLATRRVFAFSVTYNIATAVIGFTGHLSPLAAAILMPLSSVCTLSLVAFTFRRSIGDQTAPHRSPLPSGAREPEGVAAHA
ncbi:heavy metal translocating P-type ATPase metal-binding domain-containing protein [Prosthecobacter sp.]|uniref:heavy metal translocating P-type ATPase n=1 Tax=Prosthecobacter sp. TaxID=1965333 RepID=UPI001D73EF11|nr:heavy metal translocating P-type ATPase metal-binding domain-containing protein [Prosthecobacter sp.]MCB1277089.1 heavy metal translocating P-type ATPase metal-binding domain-containing protein [Prosthecobacter sp.]